MSAPTDTDRRSPGGGTRQRTLGGFGPDRAGPDRTSSGQDRPSRKAPRRTRPGGRSATTHAQPQTSVGRRNSRFAIVSELDGPKVRLGLLWLVLGLAALAFDIFLAAVLFAGIGGLSAHQTSVSWQRAGERPQRRIAIVFAAGIPIAAAFSHFSTGLWILIVTVFSLLVALRQSAADELPMQRAVYTLQAALFPGLAAAAPILAFHHDKGAAIVLFVLIAAYDCGDFLVGSGAATSFEGPLAGVLAVAVISFSLWVIDPPPFEGAAIWIFGLAVAIFAPVGQMVASAILPNPRIKAPALRRLDTMLVVGPVFLIMLRGYIG